MIDQEKRLADLRKELGAAAAANAALRLSLLSIQADGAQAASALSSLRVKYEASTKTTTALNAQLTALRAEREPLVVARGEAGAVAAARVDALMEAHAGRQELVGALASSRDAAQKSADEAATALAAAQHRARSDKPQVDNSQSAQLVKPVYGGFRPSASAAYGPAGIDVGWAGRERRYLLFRVG